MGGGLASLTLFYYRVLGLAPAARPRREHFVFAKKRSALFLYRVLGLAPAARPRREHFVFAKKRSALFLSRENLQAIGAQL